MIAGPVLVASPVAVSSEEVDVDVVSAVVVVVDPVGGVGPVRRKY